MPLIRLNKYFVKKKVLTSSDDPDRRRKILEASQSEGAVMSYFYFPFQVRHTAYSILELRRIYQIYSFDEIDQNAVLRLGSHPVSGYAMFCAQVRLSLARETNAGTIKRKLDLWTSRYGDGVESVCQRLSKLESLTFKCASTDAEALRLDIVGANHTSSIHFRGASSRERSEQIGRGPAAREVSGTPEARRDRALSPPSSRSLHQDF